MDKGKLPHQINTHAEGKTVFSGCRSSALALCVPMVLQRGSQTLNQTVVAAAAFKPLEAC
eukprot:2222470-Pleurochrysis_carterae.AAC.1